METLFGRKRWIPGAQSSREIKKFARIARNTPIQGTGADMMKMALVEVDKLDSVNLVLCVHDELVAEVPADRSQDYAESIKGAMIDAGRRLVDAVPTAVEYNIGSVWSKA